MHGGASESRDGSEFNRTIGARDVTKVDTSRNRAARCRSRLNVIARDRSEQRAYTYALNRGIRVRVFVHLFVKGGSRYTSRETRRDNP